MLQCEIKRHITPNGYYLIKIHTTLTPNEEPERCSNTSKGPSLQLHVSRLLEVEAKTTNCLVTWGRCNLPLRHTVLWGQYGKENIVSSNNAGFTPQMQASLRWVWTNPLAHHWKSLFELQACTPSKGKEAVRMNVFAEWQGLSDFSLSQKEHLLKVRLTMYGNMWTELNTSRCRGSCWQLGNDKPQSWQALEVAKVPCCVARVWPRHILPVPASPRSVLPTSPLPGWPSQQLLPVPNVISQVSVSFSTSLCQPMLPFPWPSNPSAPGPSPSLPLHQCGPSFWWVGAAHGHSFWSPGIEMLCKEKAPGARPEWASTDFFNSTEFYWACTMHSDCCWCRYRFYLFDAAPVLHLHQDFSSLHRSIKCIMSLLSVGVMGQSDLWSF